MSACTLQVEGREPITFECGSELTILDAAAQAGWELPYSCRRGICDTCRATVVSGVVVPAAEADGSALLCQTRAIGDVCIAPDRAEPRDRAERKRVRAKLYRVRMAAPDVAIVDLRFPAGVRAKFKAGQYLQLLLDNESPRSFSIASAPKASDGAQLHVRVLPGSVFGTRVLPQLKPGDALELELPFGDFFLREGDAPVLMVAGGTGFAPMQSLLDEALPRLRERPFTLYWGARDAAGLYALEAVRKWQQKFANFNFVGVISNEVAEPPFRSGLVHEAVLADIASLADHQVYVCGAPALVSAARDAFVHTRGLPVAHFYADAFATSGG